MIRRPGRLYQALKPTDNLFVLHLGNGRDFPDDQIVSIATHRGSTTAGGLSPSTATFTIDGEIGPSWDQACSLNMTTYSAALIADLTGVDYEPYWQRWTGRIGGQQVTDTATRRSTTVQAAHWAAQLTLSPATAVAQRTAPGLPHTYDSMWWHALKGAGGGFTFLPSTYSDWDAFYFDPAGTNDTRHLSPDDVMNKAGRDIGVLFRTLRDGTFQAVNLVAQTDRVNAYTGQPIARRQVLSPATWRQPVANPGQVTWTQRDPNDPTQIGQWSVAVGGPGNDFDRPAKASNIDTTEVVPRTQCIEWAMNAAANRAGFSSYLVPQVTVDMLALLTSDRQLDREQAAQLLSLDHGDPVALAYDWPPLVQGITFATSITETITRDEWTMTLGLTPTRNVTGQNPIGAPGFTWDTAYPLGTVWDQPVNTWNETPAL